MTGWVASWETGADVLAGVARRDADVIAYRDATADVVAELAGPSFRFSGAAACRILARRLRDPAFAAVLSATPLGPEAVIERVLREVRGFRPSERSSAGSLNAMVRIVLLTQIDVLWWGHLSPYLTDADVLSSPDLLDLDALRRGEMLLFSYRKQTSTLLGRAARSAGRFAAPDRTPRTAGLRFACARPELIVLLNQIAASFARTAPAGVPPLWVTSLARSVDHQRHLRGLGYAALLPSAHCVGYAADIEMNWFRRYGANQVLQEILLERQRAGDVNVIDEGQAWHVCVRPGAGHALRLIPEQAGG